MRIFADTRRPDIRQMFAQLNEAHFDSEIPDIPVVWNGRMTTTAGYCRYRKEFTGNLYPTKIDLSLRLFESNGFPEAEVKQTLIHEMVHAYLIHKYNQPGHTPSFQRMMTQITGVRKNHRCHNYDVSGVKREVKWSVICTRCGYSHGYKRKPKYSRYTHRGCGGSMIVQSGNIESKAKTIVKIF